MIVLGIGLPELELIADRDVDPDMDTATDTSATTADAGFGVGADAEFGFDRHQDWGIAVAPIPDEADANFGGRSNTDADRDDPPVDRAFAFEQDAGGALKRERDDLRAAARVSQRYAAFGDRIDPNSNPYVEDAPAKCGSQAPLDRNAAADRQILLVVGIGNMCFALADVEAPEAWPGVTIAPMVRSHWRPPSGAGHGKPMSAMKSPDV